MSHRMWIAASLALALTAAVACDRKEDRQGARTRTDDRTTTGQRTDDRYTTGQTSSVDADRDFMVKACQANLAEVEAGRLAESKATNADVKKFAQHMVEDHTAANDQLMSLAGRTNFRLPARPDDAHQKDVAKLAGMSGAEFDRKYMEMMVTDHQKAVALFEKWSKDAKDDDVRAWAEKTLPKLRDHLTMARDLSGKVGGQPSAD
jgi:putative membrane protein